MVARSISARDTMILIREGVVLGDRPAAPQRVMQPQREEARQVPGYLHWSEPTGQISQGRDRCVRGGTEQVRNRTGRSGAKQAGQGQDRAVRVRTGQSRGE